MGRKEKKQAAKLFCFFAALFAWVLIGPAAKVSAGTTYITMTVGEERTLYPASDDVDYGARNVAAGGGWLNRAIGFYEIQSPASVKNYCKIKALKPTNSPVILRLDYYYRIGSGTAIYQGTGYVDYQITIKAAPCTHPSFRYIEIEAPTCTREGRCRNECTKCGYTMNRTVLPTGHSLKKIEAVAPTAEAEGNIACWRCGSCGKYFEDARGKTEISKEDTALARLETDPPREEGGGPQSPGDDNSTADGGNGSPDMGGGSGGAQTGPDTGQPGSGESRPEADKKGQDLKGSSCIVKKMRYTVTGKNTVTLTGTTKPKRSTTSLSVGSTVKIKGKKYKVTAIANGAFKGYTKLKSVVIGDNVVQIGSDSFSGCKKLSKAVLGKNVKKISARAFYNCGKLKVLIIKSKKLKSVGSGAIKKIYKKAVIKASWTKTCKKLFSSKTGYKKTMKIKKL